jgi:hypothetical protein
VGAAGSEPPKACAVAVAPAPTYTTSLTAPTYTTSLTLQAGLAATCRQKARALFTQSSGWRLAL